MELYKKLPSDRSNKDELCLLVEDVGLVTAVLLERFKQLGNSDAGPRPMFYRLAEVWTARREMAQLEVIHLFPTEGEVLDLLTIVLSDIGRTLRVLAQ